MIQIDMEKPSACWWEDEENNTHLCPFMDKEFDCLIQGHIGYWSFDGQYEDCPLHEVTADPDTVSRQDARMCLTGDITAMNIEQYIKMVDKRLEQLPPSTTPSRPKGHWIKGKMWSEGIGMGETYGFYYTCSECNSSVKGGYDKCGKDFCEKCGADMRGTEYDR